MQGSPSRCDDGHGVQLHPVPAARPAAPACWGRRWRRCAAMRGGPRGPARTQPSPAGGAGGGVMGCPHPLSPHSLCCTHRQDAQCPDQPRVGEEGTAAQLEQWATPAGMDGGGRSESLFCLAQPTVGPPCSPIHSGCWGHHLLLDSLQLEAVVLRGARQVTTTWVTSA